MPKVDNVTSYYCDKNGEKNPIFNIDTGGGDGEEI